MFRTKTSAGIHRVSGTSRRRDPGDGDDDSSGPGQRLNTSQPGGSRVADGSSAIYLSLHAGALFVDESGGAVVWDFAAKAFGFLGFRIAGRADTPLI